MPYEGGGVQATVFFQHVQRFAQGGPASLEQVLGHVMAHETGHLLLWTKSHAPKGIMKASWSREDLRQIARGQLPFTTQQAELMKTNLITRLRQEEYLKGAVTPISASQELSIQE